MLKNWLFAWTGLVLISCSAKKQETNESLESLGHQLFFDTRLSYNNTRSCASCHDPKFAFSDGYRRSITASGERVLHNAPSLINIADHYYFDWADPGINSLLKQSDRPLLSISPVEMGFTNHEQEILKRFKTPITFPTIKKALEAYVRSLRSLSSPYDKYMNGDTAALSLSAKQGMLLFFSDKLKCASCHRPPLFTNASVTTNIDSIYFNTGLYYIYPPGDNGLRKHTNKKEDDGKFKTPSLRNIALTAPYTHDGSVNNLEDMIDIYARGGRNVGAGPFHGDGKQNPNKNKNISGFSLAPQEKKQLIEFLFALTDSSVLINPKFQNPFHTTND